MGIRQHRRNKAKVFLPDQRPVPVPAPALEPRLKKPFQIVDFLQDKPCLFVSRNRRWISKFHRDMMQLNAWPEFPMLQGRTIVYRSEADWIDRDKHREYALILQPGPWRTCFANGQLQVLDTFSEPRVLFPLQFGSWPLQLEFPNFQAFQAFQARQRA